jgi:peptidoglycan/LPS O-acetylase OafA/YrhL
VSFQSGPTLPRAPALDGLRAIAVAAVLLYHAQVTWLPGGFLGVDVFFTLSGYLITSLLLAELARSDHIHLARFWLRRARRLLPAVVVVVLTALVISLFLSSGEAGETRSDALSSLFYVNNWHQILGEHSYFVAAGRPSPLRHLWSLSVEEQFYLLWPLLLGFGLAKLGRLRFLHVAIAAAVASAVLMAVLYDPSGDPSRVYYGTDTRATQLLVGAALAFVWPIRGWSPAPAGRRAAAVLDAGAAAGLAGLVVVFTAAHEFDTWLYRGGLTVVALISALLIAAIVHPACRVARLLATPPMRWIGERSYGIYLWHWPVMVLTRPKLDVDWSPWVLVPFQIGLTVAIAAASYRYVEMPFRRGEAQQWIREHMRRLAPRRRLAVAGGTTAVVLGLGAWMLQPAATATPRATHTKAAAPLPKTATTAKTARPVNSNPPLAIGASVMLGSETALKTAISPRLVVDAAVGRWPADIASRLEEYRRSGLLPSRVVVQMGENGPIRDEDMQRVRAALQGVNRVVFVNVHVPRSWQDDVNATLEANVGDWPEAVIADWNGAARADQLYADGIHPTPDGQATYARVVARALRGRSER